MTDIPNCKNFAKFEAVNKGWSNDKKYYIETTNGEKQLLRVSDISEYDKKKTEYDIMHKVAAQGIPMSLPIEFGVCNDGKNVYSLLTWISGEDAEIVVPKLPQNEQYKMGITAGQILAKMHSIPAPNGLPSWEQRVLNKINNKYKQYLTCGVKVPHDNELFKFLQDNMDCLKNVTTSFCHGDYHCGNMIVDKDGKLNIIDFNRWGFEDSYEEFNRLAVLTRKISIPFAKGQIVGYFDNSKPTEKFFRRMAFYTALNALFSIVWSIPFGEKEIKGDLERSQMVYEDYKGFTVIIPTWWEE